MSEWNNPGFWRAEPRHGLLSGKWRYAVNLNNHTDVAWFDTQREAELDAARRNYEHGSYARPRMLGL